MNARVISLICVFLIPLLMPFAALGSVFSYSPEPKMSMVDFHVKQYNAWADNISMMLPPYKIKIEMNISVNLPTKFTEYSDGEAVASGTLHPEDPDYPSLFYVNRFFSPEKVILAEATKDNPISIVASPGWGSNITSSIYKIVGSEETTDITGGSYCVIRPSREGSTLTFHIIQNWSIGIIFQGDEYITSIAGDLTGQTYFDYAWWISDIEEEYGLQNGSLVGYVNEACSRIDSFIADFNFNVSLQVPYDAVDSNGNSFLTYCALENIGMKFSQTIPITPQYVGSSTPVEKNIEVKIYQTFTDDDFFIAGKPLLVHVELQKTHTITLTGYDRRLDGGGPQYTQRGSSLDFYVVFDSPGTRKLHFVFEDGSVHIKDIDIHPAGTLSLEFIPLGVGEWKKYSDLQETEGEDIETYDELFKVAAYSKDFIEAIYPVKNVDIKMYPWFYNVSFLWFYPFGKVNINSLYSSNPEKAIKKTLWYFHSRHHTSADRIVLLVPKGWLSPIGAVGTTLTNRPYVWFGWSFGMAPYRVAIVEVPLPADPVMGQVVAHEITHTFRFDDLPDDVQNSPPDVNNGFWAKRGREMSGCYDVMADTWTLTSGKIWIYKKTYSYLYHNFFSSGDPTYISGVFSNGTLDITVLSGDYGNAPMGGNATLRLLKGGAVVAEREFEPVDIGGEYGFMLDFSSIPDFDTVSVIYAGKTYSTGKGNAEVRNLRYENGMLKWDGIGEKYEVRCDNEKTEFFLGVTDTHEMNIRTPGGKCIITVTAINGTSRTSSSIEVQMDDSPPLCALITDKGVAYAIAYDPDGDDVNVTIQHGDKVFGDWCSISGGTVIARAEDSAGHETVVRAVVPSKSPRYSSNLISWIPILFIIAGSIAAILVLWQEKKFLGVYRRKHQGNWAPPQREVEHADMQTGLEEKREYKGDPRG